MFKRQAATFMCVNLNFIHSSFFPKAQNYYSNLFKAIRAFKAEANVHFLNTYISLDIYQKAHLCIECDKMVIKYHDTLRKTEINIVDYL